MKRTEIAKKIEELESEEPSNIVEYINKESYLIQLRKQYEKN